jgi:hypothetical protein
MRKRPMGFRIYEQALANNFLEKHFHPTHETLEMICDHIRKRSPKEELALRSFFFDYARHVELIRSRQPQGGIYACIIANSMIRGVTVPTVDFIEAVHRNTGYELLHKWTYEIKRHYMKFPRRSNSGKILQDHILIFRTTP